LLLASLSAALFLPSTSTGRSASERASTALDAAMLSTLLTPLDADHRGRLEHVEVTPGRAVIRHRLPSGGALHMVLVPADSDEPAYATLPSLRLYHRRLPPGADATQVGALLDAVVNRLKEVDTGQWRLPQRTARDAHPEAGPWRRQHLGLGFGLLVLALLLLPVVAWRAAQAFKGLDRRSRLVLFLLLGAAAVLRVIIAPHQVVTMYVGYRLVDAADTLDQIFRYGVGVQVQWHALLRLLGADHAHLIGTHAFVGVATAGLLAAALLRAGWPGRQVLGGLALIAWLPLLVWSDASDSLHVLILFWSAASLLAAISFARDGRWIDAAAAVVCLALAAHGRPEHVLFGPLWVGVMIAAMRAGGQTEGATFHPRAGLLAWLGMAAVFALLVAPQALYALDMRGAMAARDTWPGSLAELLVHLPGSLLERNVLLDRTLLPSALTLAAIGALVSLGSPAVLRLRIGWFAVGLAWMCMYYIDLSPASQPRLQVVMALPAAWLAGAWMAELVFLPGSGRSWRVGLAVILAPGLLVGGWQSAARLWQPSNEQAEESFIREALAALPDGPVRVARPGRRDFAPDRHTHAFFPDYLLRHRRPAAVPIDLAELAHPGTDPAVADRVLLGMRCYTRFRRDGEPAPERWQLPACASLRASGRLAPVLERTVTNQGDVGLPYHPRQPQLLLGLYRVTHHASSSKARSELVTSAP